MGKFKTRLVINLEFSFPDSENEEEMREVARKGLEYTVTHLAGEGLLTGESSLEVESLGDEVFIDREVSIECPQCQHFRVFFRGETTYECSNCGRLF